MDNIGLLPPQALDVEEAVLGALMLDKFAFPIVTELLTAESFYREANAKIFEAMVGLSRKHEPIDILTVVQELRDSGYLELAGGVSAVVNLTNRITSAANVEAHSRIIQEKHFLRQLIAISATLTSQAYQNTTDAFELLNWAESAIFGITRNIGGNFNSTISELYHEQIKQIEAKKEGEVLGYLTGLRAVDNTLFGIKKQELMILAARPGMGKTAMALTIARNLSQLQNIPVAFFSLEMSRAALCSRFTSILTDIPIQYLINHDVRGVMFDKLMIGKPLADKTKLNIDDQGGITIMQLRAKVRKYIQKYNIEVIFVDYLTKIKGENIRGRSKASEVDEIASELKNIAKEFNIAVIALAQLNRDLEKRENKRPQLSDLKESGGIEQEADIVTFLYRPDYYDIKTGANGETLQEGFTEVIIAKNRNGSLSTEGVIFNKTLTRFENINHYEQQPEYSTYGKDVDNKDLF